MAAGSQAEKGIWALLVDAVKKIKVLIKKLKFRVLIMFKFHSEVETMKAIIIMRAKSPTRFEKIVSRPEFSEFELKK